MNSFDALNKIVEKYKSKEEPKTNEAFSFRMPFSNPKNIGVFSPNARTDARHSHHDGVDLQASRGTPIVSIAPGIVIQVNSDSTGGNNIVIQHDNNYKSYYAHMDSISDDALKSFKNKTKINSEIIGTVGNTGNAKTTSPHLHLQVWKNGTLIDPASILPIPKPDIQAMKHYDSSKDKPSSGFSLKDSLKNLSKTAYINYLIEKMSK